jgi:hypothetical protein
MSNTNTPNIRLGLCCLNTQLRDQKPTIFCSRGMILKTAIEMGMPEIQRRAILNLKDVIKMLDWNENVNGLHILNYILSLPRHEIKKINLNNNEFFYLIKKLDINQLNEKGENILYNIVIYLVIIDNKIIRLLIFANIYMCITNRFRYVNNESKYINGLL